MAVFPSIFNQQFHCVSSSNLSLYGNTLHTPPDHKSTGVCPESGQFSSHFLPWIQTVNTAQRNHFFLVFHERTSPWAYWCPWIIHRSLRVHNVFSRPFVSAVLSSFLPPVLKGSWRLFINTTEPLTAVWLLCASNWGARLNGLSLLCPLKFIPQWLRLKGETMSPDLKVRQMFDYPLKNLLSSVNYLRVKLWPVHQNHRINCET